MKKRFHKIISIGIILSMLMSMPAAFATEPAPDMFSEDLELSEITIPSEIATSSDAESILERARAADPISDLRFTGEVKSSCKNDTSENDTSENDVTKETIGSLTRSSKSLWYKDGVLATNVITTYDNHGTVKHYRDKVEVYVYQEG